MWKCFLNFFWEFVDHILMACLQFLSSFIFATSLKFCDTLAKEFKSCCLWQLFDLSKIKFKELWDQPLENQFGLSLVILQDLNVFHLHGA